MVGFWSPHLTATSVKEGPVFSFSSSDISREPFSLTAPELQWVEVNLDIEQEVGHLLRLLNNHYVKDRASVLCYRLSSAFLRWVLRVPGWKKEYLVGVEDKNARKLIAFVSGTPLTVFCKERTFSMIVVNFLCIHEQFRGQGLAPIVIDELSRRAAIDGIFQAVFTSSYTKMFRSLSTALHYHRFLNVPNLVKAGFCRGPRIERYFHVASYQSYQWGPLAVVDVNSVFELLNSFFSREKLFYPKFSRNQFCHLFLPRQGIAHSFVARTEKGGGIVAFSSFYEVLLASSNGTVKMAKELYSGCLPSISLEAVRKDMVVEAKKRQMDVYTLLGDQTQTEQMKEIRTVQGTGFLSYFLFNWRTECIPFNQIAFTVP
ncbi:glycylpeptide N-tetradecanoyltransferase/ myristoyltransferase [Galdieria sulphuraria]|uniref:Glycylpeptide N-tetradecanoyltransferase n=1 Tax=Galdieria sulphuraria TaxID=130081 RepID=M2XQM4_GALSU|nr:glycylpeptide N-tetradecanoyltransferase/ myristoyltransferase [Galdieria sulphuraria]EME25744.1 glycylpeptide N-tetradecanoyltransferase/ myristoyltransferase [Galdieria sulphuraria]|eukprot:XP_005702264.1 glycylpeptide N-tetradecanoyltransferase/ myristoyltransferase [Galdieria sulphuraria]